MIFFDPIFKRSLLDDPVGGYQWSLGSFDFTETKKLGALSSNAAADLSDAIYCLLVGYDEPAQRLLKRAHEWVSIAIETNEIHSTAHAKDGSEAERYGTLAMCNWLLHGQHDTDSWAHYIQYYERFVDGTILGRDKTNVTLSMASYIDAKAFREGVKRCDLAKIFSPPSISSISSEGQMGRVLCEHALGDDRSDADIKAAAEKFLQRKVNLWLIDGHALHAAHWMKLVHWQEGGELTPRQTVLKCYDYLPAQSQLQATGAETSKSNLSSP